MKWQKPLMIATLASLATFGAGMMGWGDGEDNSAETSPAAKTDRPGPHAGGPPPHRELWRSVFDREAMQATLAEVLGLSVDELKAAREAGKTPRDLAQEQGVDPETVRTAMEAYRTQALAQAVAAGILTQEQADRIASRPHPRPRFRRGGSGAWGRGRPPRWERLKSVFDREAMAATHAEALGLSVEELKTAREAGKTPRDLAQEQGVDPETVRTAMEAYRTEALAQAVTEGILTQEQADRIARQRPHGPGPHRGHRPPPTDQ